MKALVNSILLVAAVLFLTPGCGNQEEAPDPSGISGSLINQSECKNFKSGNLKFTTADTFSCVHFLYDDANNLLTLNHINAGFNCCPIEITCHVSQSKDTIIITESEKMPACNCDCLFDLDIEVQNVVKHVYQVKFIEPYALEMTPLIIEMNLNEISQGEFCVIRKGYPWGY
jgi:hypothetical protein